jgi:hypothetical protein
MAAVFLGSYYKKNFVEDLQNTITASLFPICTVVSEILFWKLANQKQKMPVVAIFFCFPSSLGALSIHHQFYYEYEFPPSIYMNRVYVHRIYLQSYLRNPLG